MKDSQTPLTLDVVKIDNCQNCGASIRDNECQCVGEPLICSEIPQEEQSSNAKFRFDGFGAAGHGIKIVKLPFVFKALLVVGGIIMIPLLILFLILLMIRRVLLGRG